MPKVEAPGHPGHPPPLSDAVVKLSIWRTTSDSVKRSPRVVPSVAVLQSVSLKLHQANTSFKKTPKVDPCCSSVIFSDNL